MNRRTLLSVAGLAALAVAAPAAVMVMRSRPPASDVGGPFRMSDADGRPVTEADLKGSPSIVFFGFTYCPDVCPTTLSRLTQWFKALGDEARDLKVFFVSVDPERDTGPQLKAYLANFDPRIRGLRGDAQALAAMAKAYRAYYKRVELPGGTYTMDHSAALYLMDDRGRFREVISYEETDADALAALHRLIG